jgi:Glucose / Sorbosone dehydrogenase
MKKLIITLLFPSLIFGQSPLIKLTLVSNGFGAIVDIVSAGDSRLFIVDGNLIKIWANNQTNPTPFLDMNTKANWIMAVAFHPNYAQNGFFYVKYKNLTDACVIARFSRNTSEANLAVLTSETILFSYPDNNGHEGGDLEFGKDGFLYTATGDGAPGARNTPGDEFGNAQSLGVVKGKILRFDVDSPSHIPLANPFQMPGDGIPDEIIALGLRNPWKFSFDRQSGDMWLGDVGQDEYEEVNYVPAGDFENRNFGWSCYEGNAPHLSQNCPTNAVFTFPILVYEGYTFNGHKPASVTGGYVYRGQKHPALLGYYCYADYNAGKFWLLKKQPDGSVSNDFKGVLMSFPTTFGEDNNGELYVATFDKFYQISACGLEPNLVLSGQINTDSYFNATETIKSTSHLLPQSKIYYEAIKNIELNPGFETDLGGVFQVNVKGCL